MFKKLTQGDNIYIFKMFRFAKPHALKFGIGHLLSSFQGFAFDFVMASLSGNIMAAIIAGSTDMVISAVTYFVILLLIFFVLLGIGEFLYTISLAEIMQDVKQMLFRTFMQSGIEDATLGHSGDGIAAINTDADTAEGIFGGFLNGILGSIIATIGSIVVIFTIDWRLGLAALIVGILSFIFRFRFAKPLAEIGKKQLEANADAVKTVSNIFSGAIAMRAYSIQPKALITFDKDNRKLRVLDFKNALIHTWLSAFSLVEFWLSLIVTFALGGWLAATGEVAFYNLMIVLGMFRSLVASISGIAWAYAGLQVHIAGAKRVFAILEQKDVMSKNERIDSRKTPVGYQLRLHNLNFTYQESNRKNAPQSENHSILNTDNATQSVDKPALVNINLEIGENQMVAFVGESGSGKSTLLRTIIGLYERDELNINLGGMAFNESSLKSWRQNFAYVDQSSQLFDMTVGENIAMGKGGKASDDEIIAAAKRAVAHEFIEEFEDGYETACGEKGANLSGGQKQRIAIARALVRKAPILVFDEATSALDTKSERSTMETIESLRRDHTILMVTHNLNNVVTADQIVIMENGRIAEMGTHDELLGKNGLYTKLLKEGTRHEIRENNH